MLKLKRLTQYGVLGISLTCAPSHASIIQSMTIEEIGIASGGLGSSAGSYVGGEFFAAGTFSDPGFVSAGGTDGAILMGHVQGMHAFTPGFAFFGNPSFPHTLYGAPTGSIAGGTMTLDLAGWGTWWSNIQFVMSPDAGTLLTSVSQIDADHYYYTADWSHVITAADATPFTGIATAWHLEGIATVPEPSTLWLLGASALGLMVSRCRKHP